MLLLTTTWQHSREIYALFNFILFPRLSVPWLVFYTFMAACDPLENCSKVQFKVSCDPWLNNWLKLYSNYQDNKIVCPPSEWLGFEFLLKFEMRWQWPGWHDDFFVKHYSKYLRWIERQIQLLWAMKSSSSISSVPPRGWPYDQSTDDQNSWSCLWELSAQSTPLPVEEKRQLLGHPWMLWSHCPSTKDPWHCRRTTTRGWTEGDMAQWPARWDSQQQPNHCIKKYHRRSGQTSEARWRPIDFHNVERMWGG